VAEDYENYAEPFGNVHPFKVLIHHYHLRQLLVLMSEMLKDTAYHGEIARTSPMYVKT
jgi:hypothetical protein